MTNKLFRKIIGSFGYKLIGKDTIKNERLISNKSFLKIDKLLNAIFQKKKIGRLIQIGANDGERFDLLNFYIKKYQCNSLLVEPIKENFERLIVNYKDLDFIIVDMPPGTGDTQLTFSQEIKMDGAIIVSTPQEVALLDVKRGIKMFDKLGVKILGLVDNMSYFTGDDGKKYKIFGEGGVKRTAEEFGKEFLGEIPLNPEVGKCGDEGKPIVEANPDHEISKIYLEFANKIKKNYL